MGFAGVLSMHSVFAVAKAMAGKFPEDVLLFSKIY
jgi:hypothetical protein